MLISVLFATFFLPLLPKGNASQSQQPVGKRFIRIKGAFFFFFHQTLKLKEKQGIKEMKRQKIKMVITALPGVAVV